MHKGFVAIVGSRETPLDELELMIRLGRTCTDLGLAVSSGDAFGADRAGWYGSKQSERYIEVGSRIYLTESYKNRARSNELGFIIAEDYPEKWDMAKALAFSARGNFNGLNEYGIGLHSRNCYQILGHTLDEPVQLMFFYAKPIGDGTRCSGGTNTAFQLAKQANIPKIVNLATTEGLRYVEDFLKRYEKDYPYIDTKWIEILKYDDPRLEYLND